MKFPLLLVDKCFLFGIRKSATLSVQFLPKLIINKDLVPTVKIGESFKYLGRYFSFSIQNLNIELFYWTQLLAF